MRKGFSISLIATILFGGGYFYYIAQAVCPAPISYQLGDIDERFELSKEEVRVIVSEAESIWEDATGRNLFSYEEEGDLTINFVFDDRQEFIDAEDTLKEQLDATENISDAIKETYATLVADYNNLRITYADKVESYEQKLNTYNAEVEKYNNRGGAPEEVYESLTRQKSELDAEQSSLNELSSKLNVLVKEINNIGEKGNVLINTYNSGVNFYNEQFGKTHEFTQGDYTDGTIQIYTFNNRDELKLVLVHELGHALSLDHVEGEASLMHYLIGEQSKNIVLSDADLAEFNRVCGDNSIWENLKTALRL